MIRLVNVFKKYTENSIALRNITLDIEQGEFIYLVGPSGAGKSTLIKLMTCEERLSHGLLNVGNVDLCRLPNQKIPEFRRQIGIIPQDIVLLESLTVYKNLVYVLHAIGEHRKNIKKKVTVALEEVGMLDYKDYYPDELSIGQKQKIAIARAILNQPKILLADEPTGNLDNKSAIDVMKILYQLNQKGTTILMATHNSTIVNTIRYRVLEIKKGMIVRDQKEGSYGLKSDYKDIFVI
ncbi:MULTISPECIES: ATP-binding cassette domain-containing protein [Vagococcus]|uniref:Cell division transporter, ATP-binding protein FtsE (TC 3.A.5.1.1) n=1 Tax=Vagococcus fluvialis bH819 TaxID=1255619 RepID=A0A1X6WRJ1_9ENTE|nr:MULTISPECIES: ATP-binding cassette domain-containing protein [Vagococcus]SLM86897.1 Cell division transporter, ATP-binding protein FtsE (TC 3.A.5.1.1) [Vagococcus fluvialis bH819]HCM88646.1 cell division ATP-binding protein FtsE [Vagococcus sp.]